MMEERLYNFDTVVGDLYKERQFAINKHGWEKTPENPNMSDEKNLVLIAEEFGEIARAMTYDEGNAKNLYDEYIDTANMCLMAAAGLRKRGVV